MAQNNTALATTTDATPAIITTPEQYREALAKWSEHYHVLTPFVNVTGLATQHGLIASVIQINPDPSRTGPGEVYDGLPFLKPGEVALAKIGLRKVADCGGLSIETTRTDPRTIAHYWEFKAIARYRGIDGSTITREASAEWDLRDGSPRLKGWTANQVSEGRKNGFRNAECRAINAVIREVCGLKQHYTKQELVKPFVAVRCVYQPDTSDPETRRQLTEHHLRGTSALYPAARTSEPSADHDVIDVQPVTSPSGAGPTPPATTTAAAAAPDPDQPPTEDAVRIVDVQTKTGETKGKKWTRYAITDSRGEVHSTFDKTLADAAVKFCESKAWAEVAVEQDGDYKNLVEIAPAGSAPKLPGMGDL